jgi:hypothetical protein
MSTGMWKQLCLIIFLCGISSLYLQNAQAHPLLEENRTSDLPLCLPERVASPFGECLHLGPARYLSEQAKIGITFPPRPLPAINPDPQLADLTGFYFRLARDSTPVFGSLESAIEGEPVLYHLETEFGFVTPIDWAEIGGERFHMIAPGIWMRGKDLARLWSTSPFQGLVFRSTPEKDFGWARNEVEVRRTPGYLARDKVKTLYPYDLVQIYRVAMVDDAEWFLVGPDQWVEGRQVGRVVPNPVPPEGVTNGRWIEVNLAEQTLSVYEQGQLVFATLVTTGVEGTWTRPGLFQVYKKVEAETMQGASLADRSDFYYLEDVPWTMYFDQARALHGTYWHNRFGWPASRGCVNLSPGDANWLFQWANDGDWVYVWDPTGQTPTDPGLYGDGGA